MNVLAVRQDNNGDVLLCGPALRAIAACANVTLLCGPSGRAAAETLPGVDAVLCCEANWIEANPQPVRPDEIRRLVRELSGRGFDRAVIFTSFHQSPLPAALLLRMAGIPWIAAISEDYPGSLLDLRVRDIPSDIHEVRRALALSAAAGFTLPPHDDGRLAMRIGECNPAGDGDYVVVHPGATVPARTWDPASFRNVVRLLAEHGERVVVTGGAAERVLCAEVAGREALDLSGRTDFATLARVICDARGIVVGNTGAAHVAAATGTPVVSLFPPTIPAVRFRPWMVEHRLLGDQQIACAGCRARACPHPGHPCLAGITAERVLTELEAIGAIGSLV